MVKKGLMQGGLRRDVEPRVALEKAKVAGFDGVELRVDANGLVGLPEPYNQPDRAAELARQVGLELPSITGGAFIDLFHLETDESMPEIVARTDRACQAANAMGARYMLQIPGYVQLMLDSKCPIIPYDVAYERSVTIFRALAPVAERYGVTLCAENVWNWFLLSPLEMRAFIDEINHPNVRVYFDIGNQINWGFPEQWLRILGHRVGRIHLKDFRRAVGNLNGFVTLLEGDVNWTECMRAVAEIGYDGYLVAEYGPYAHGPDELLAHLSASMDRIIALTGA